MMPILYTLVSGDDQRVVKVVTSLRRYTGIECVEDTREIVSYQGSEARAVLISASLIEKWEPHERRELYQRATDGRLKLILINGSVSFRAGNTGRMKFSAAAEDKSILRELSGTELLVKSAAQRPCESAVSTEGERSQRSLIRIEWPDHDAAEVLGIRQHGSAEIFVLSPVDCTLVTKDESHVLLPTLLPLLVCLKHHYSDACWHRKMNHANLTIDDPWLREPYGYVSYFDLLERMKEAHFHTTLAFVPWNYDRSRKNMVDLFVGNGDYYSISVHGNNHDHYEFRSYKEVPLAEQASDVHQALGRMDEFSRLTKIPYDRVMVFPQYICPEPTLEVLKENNYVASANCTTIPLESQMKDRVDHAVMPAVTEYYGFPMLKRYHPSIDRNIVNVTLYLQRPMLFYIHHYFFEHAIGEFDDIARYVNDTCRGALQWSGLGRLCEGLYMERVIGQGATEILMLSRRIRLAGLQYCHRQLHIDASELQLENCERVEINGVAPSTAAPVEEILAGPFEIAERGFLSVELFFKGNHRHHVDHIRKNNLRININRILSDFRDCVVHKNKLLRKILLH